MADLKFYENFNVLLSTKNSNNVFLSEMKYSEVLEEVKRLKNGAKLKPNYYKLLKRYDIMNVSNIEKLIVPVTDPNTIKYYVYNEELFKIIHDVHLQTGHGGRNRMEHELNAKYKNITRECLIIYLNLCEPYQRKGKTVKKGLVVKPIISSEMNSRCQVDLIDMQAQPDGNYRFILVYQDHLTKYVLLKPLTHKRAEEVAYILLDIFTTFGAPCILQSDNGREFVNKVIEELCSMWEELKIVHGKPWHSQSQGSVERANQDVENMLATWLTDNKTNKWSEGLKFIQFMKNRSLHHGIKCSPYEAMFGTRAKIGLKSTSLPESIIHKLKTDEDLETALNSINTTHEKKTEKQPKEKSVNTSSEENIDVNEEQADIIQSRQETIIEKRKESLHNLKVQASKMKTNSKHRLREGKIGESVKIRILDVDKARSDLRSILGVIMSVKNNSYEIGTTEGKLQQLYARYQFEICKESFVQIEAVPVTSPISLRKAARKFSNLGGQGYDRCNCKQQCKTNKYIPACGVYFTTYELLVRYQKNNNSEGLMNTILAGGMAGILNWLIAMPADVLKSRLQIAPEGMYPRGIRDVFARLYKEEGLKALYAGVTPVMLRAFPANAACFLGVELGLKGLDFVFPPKNNKSIEIN